MKAADKILTLLAESPIKAGDIIEALGYSVTDLLISRAIGDSFKRRGCWDGSPHQKALAKLVDSDAVLCVRDRSQDVWYKLPGQKLPPCDKPARRSFANMVCAVYRSLPDKVAGKNIEPKRDIGIDDVWHSFAEYEFLGVTLSIEGDGWELADGDPVCNWCGQTFTKKYPADVDPAIIARRIVRELKKQALQSEVS